MHETFEVTYVMIVAFGNYKKKLISRVSKTEQKIFEVKKMYRCIKLKPRLFLDFVVCLCRKYLFTSVMCIKYFNR